MTDRGTLAARLAGLLPALLPGLLLAGCSAHPAPLAIYQPPPGANEVLRGPIAGAPGLSLVVGDLSMPPGGTIPAHYHHGEEFLFVLGGSAVVSRVGQPDVVLQPGEGLRIAPGTVHSGTAGAQGVRATSSWIVPDGKPLRVPVP
ncbi:MAG: cupin domain-containing protein [Croceibacterium sp.]